MINFGAVPAGSVLPIFFTSYDANGASITLTGLAVTDIEIYKGVSITQRASDNGYALIDTDGIDVDSVTGLHAFSVDTGDNSDSGFYAAGSFYTVVVSTVTINGQVVTFIAAAFSIRAAEHTAGYPVVTIKDGTGTGEIDTTSGGVLVAAIAANAITATAIAADAITAAKVADGTIDAATFAAGAINAAAIAADAITDAKVASDVTIASVTGAVGSVTGAVGSVTGAVGSVTGSVGGNVTGSVGSVATGGIAAASFASGAINAAAIAADAIGASELAADAVTEIVSAIWKDTTAGDFTTANSIGKSIMNGVALGTGLTINAYTGNTPQTGDSYARLGAPAGTSIADDIANIAAGSGPTAVEIRQEIDSNSTQLAGIKDKTDDLTFTVANVLDANIQRVNDVVVTGDGQPGTEWGP